MADFVWCSSVRFARRVLAPTAMLVIVLAFLAGGVAAAGPDGFSEPDGLRDQEASRPSAAVELPLRTPDDPAAPETPQGRDPTGGLSEPDLSGPTPERDSACTESSRCVSSTAPTEAEEGDTGPRSGIMAPVQDDAQAQLAVAAGAGFLALLVAIILRWGTPILAWLYGFVPASWRMEREDVLAHPTRRTMLGYLESHPGATLMELADSARVRGTRAAYHIMILLREDLITVRELEGRKLYFTKTGPRADLEHVAQRRLVRTLGDPRRAPGRVLAHIRTAPGATVSQLARALGYSPGHAHYHLARLAERGLVDRVRQGRRVRHYLTANGRDLVVSVPASRPDAS